MPGKNMYAATLKSAAEHDYPPFSITDEGFADGFSVELLKAVAYEAGLSIEFKTDEWSTIKEELKEGQLDVLPLVGYSEERDEYFDFSVPYIVMYGNIFVNTGNEDIKELDDLRGRTVAVLDGDNTHEYALSNGLKDELVVLSSLSEAFILLSEGKCDAVISQSLVGERIISNLGIENVEAAKKLDNDGISEIKVKLEGFEQKFCFAVREGDTDLLAKLNEGLAIVSANGTYTTLYEKWFPFMNKSRLSFMAVLATTGIVLVPLIILMLGISLVYIKKQVKQKTKELEKASDEIIKMEAHMRNQQKLEAIGVLAGGVAHEINNPLNGIMNYNQLILDSVDKDSETGQYATEAIYETERISTIVKNLLQFSRIEEKTYMAASIKTILWRVNSLMKALIVKDNIEMETDIPDYIPEIVCNEQEIQQVLMNLIGNSRDSLNKKFGKDGNKIISVKAELLQEEKVDGVRIIVEDNGTGISSDVMEKVFDPFFTTKTRDEGTGLGLSISYGIIKEHGGRLHCESEEGTFTRFIIELPLMQ